MGSARVARIAERHTEIKATAMNGRGVAKNAMGSIVFTPKRKLFKKRVSQNAPPT